MTSGAVCNRLQATINGYQCNRIQIDNQLFNSKKVRQLTSCKQPLGMTVSEMSCKQNNVMSNINNNLSEGRSPPLLIFIL